MTMRTSLFVIVLTLAASASGAAAKTISLDTLLDEMVDRTAVARFPEPAYVCKQASSHDRASVAADKPGWFANQDKSHFLRSETNQGRTEWVLMDAEGPGAIVRFWVTAPHYLGTLRVYLDGVEEPVLAERADRLVGGAALVGPPLSAERSRGRNLYLPIPYAKRCKVTFDRANFHETNDRKDLFYYQINYRDYPTGVEVTSFSKEQLAAAKNKIAKVQRMLLDPAGAASSEDRHAGQAKNDPGREVASVEIPPGGERTISPGFSSGPGAVCQIALRLDAKDPIQALRSTVLTVEADGVETVWCPVGDFFGSGVGVNPFTGWYRKVDKDGMMTCWWVMPFQKSFFITLKNLGSQPVKATFGPLVARPWKWDDRSMYFHANWRQQRRIPTVKGIKGAIDWTFLKAHGQGVLVGDTLALVNRSERWWGEGDEKIFVDGEKFPSHFGTGTEDYYGYAWGNTTFFESPFHAQPRAEGPRNFGNVTNTRVRSLDAIPFHKSLDFDMEIWHCENQKTTVDYAATTYWYARPGATTNHRPDPAEAAQPVHYNIKPPVPKKKKAT